MTQQPAPEESEPPNLGHLLEAVGQVQAYLLPTLRHLCLQPKGWALPESAGSLENGPEKPSSTGLEKGSLVVKETEG